MSLGTRFTKAQLEQLGFYQTVALIWSKDGAEADTARASAANVEPSTQRRPKSKALRNKAQGKGGIQEGVRYRLVIHSFRTRLVDPSNAYFKAIEDSAVEKGLIPDDSPEYCDQPLFLQTKVKKNQERTEIELLAYSVD